MKMPASETAPMAPTLIATRGLSGAVCAAAGEPAIASAAEKRPTTKGGATGRNVMIALLGVSCSCERGKLGLALSSRSSRAAGYGWLAVTVAVAAGSGPLPPSYDHRNLKKRGVFV